MIAITLADPEARYSQGSRKTQIHGRSMSNSSDPHSPNSILGPTLHFKGELRAEENLLILGTVEGSIEHTAGLTVGEQGKIKANIQAATIKVEGTVEGNLQATTSVSISASADVEGDVNAPTVAVFEGARFKGRIDMGAKKTAAKPHGSKDASFTSKADSAVA